MRDVGRDRKSPAGGASVPSAKQIFFIPLPMGLAVFIGRFLMQLATENLSVQETGVDSPAVLLRELVAHLRQHRTELREEWARRGVSLS